MEKEKLNRSKRAVKGTITELETYIDQTKEHNPTELEVKLKRVEQLYQKVDELKDQYYGLKDTSDLEITEIETDLEGTVDRLEALEVRIKDILNSLIIKPSIINCENEISQADSKTKLEIKLPEIPLPVFHGKFDEWPNFKSQFDNIITKNNDLNDSQKLHYLKASLLGAAKRLETLDDSFESLLKALENRFENKRLLTETYINQILEIEKLANESAGDIRNIVVILKKNIRALKLLNFDRNNLSDILLLNIILKKVDRETRKQYKETIASNEIPELDKFLEFLEKRSQILDSISRTASSSIYKHKLAVNKKTVFGYIVVGSSDNSTNRAYCGLTLSSDINSESLDKQLQAFWNIETVEEPFVEHSVEFELCETQYKNTHYRNHEGRYIVQLPLKEDPASLGDSKAVAEMRLNQLWKKLSKDEELQSLYKSFLMEYADLQHMQLVVKPLDKTASYFLPHHGVLRPDSKTTKLRVVFNASSKTISGLSLNDILSGSSDFQEFQLLQEQLVDLFKKAGMSLHKWCTNTSKIPNSIPLEDQAYDFFSEPPNTIKYLGVIWNPNLDYFTFKVDHFVARRGRCATISSDNAKNFVGAKLQFSGASGRQGSNPFKFYLKRATGNLKLTFEEFLTITTQVEGILNSRPLTPLSDDIDDLDVLTPGHFLVGRSITAIAEPRLLDKSETRLSRWQRLTKIVHYIWSKWSRDYLNNLLQRTKWKVEKTNLNLNAMVLIKEDNLPVNQWSLGRILKLFPGTDGKIGSVHLQWIPLHVGIYGNETVDQLETADLHETADQLDKEGSELATSYSSKLLVSEVHSLKLAKICSNSFVKKTGHIKCLTFRVKEKTYAYCHCSAIASPSHLLNCIGASVRQLMNGETVYDLLMRHDLLD
ncbi:uncharacterized protein [Parasteatoda tepidariorum]|uniref:uncharacterized protein n=1 Tax=Parasteatoda tepidariorum TaxID=114398 RepID=UPI0039BC8EE0